MIILTDHTGAGEKHLTLKKTCGDGDIRVLLNKYCGAQSLTLPFKGILTEKTISTLQEFPRIRFLDLSFDRSGLNIDGLVQLEGLTTMMGWFRNIPEQLGKWRLCTICESLTTLKHISIAERYPMHDVPADWQEKLNCLTQLKLLESLASRRVPSPACLAALTNLTRLELSCFDDGHRHDYYLNCAMDVVPSLPCLKALRLGPCPSKEHLQSLRRMPHLTSLVLGSTLNNSTTVPVNVSGVCNLRDVHELCRMAINDSTVKYLDCHFQVGNTHVHAWSQGHAEEEVHFCLPGTDYKLSVG